MRILVVGAGGVGTAIAAVAQQRSFFEQMTLADLDLGRAQRNAAAFLELMEASGWPHGILEREVAHVH